MKKQEQQTRKKFNALKKYYDETWDKKDHTLHVGYFGYGARTLAKAFADATDMLIKRLDEMAPVNAGSTVLDVGCGTGKTLQILCTKYGCRGVGVDISDAQIKDAKTDLTTTNRARKAKGLRLLRIKFIQGSGSDLNRLFPKKVSFTHIISQDALLLVVNKRSLFKNAFRLLVPGGALAIADFLSEAPQKTYTRDQKKLIYALVNWSGELSYAAYRAILSSIGFRLTHAEERGKDMRKTYDMLAKRLRPYAAKDAVYADLAKRYKNIVSAVKAGKMGWGLFFAIKPTI